MDFKEYYLDQAKGNYPVFRGARYQQGYGVKFQHGSGIGSIFRRFFSWAVPLLKQHALPIAKNVGKEVISNIASIATDAIEGNKVSENAKERVQKSIEKLTQGQDGKGYKSKRKITKSDENTNITKTTLRDLKYPEQITKKKYKKQKDIFD